MKNKMNKTKFLMYKIKILNQLIVRTNLKKNNLKMQY